LGLGSNPARVHFGPGVKRKQTNYFARMKLGLLRLWNRIGEKRKMQSLLLIAVSMTVIFQSLVN
jgi:hypothetical protein